MIRRLRARAAVLLLAALLGQSSVSPAATPAENALSAAALDQHIGRRLPLDLPLRDEQGRQVELADFFDGKPVILAPVWYSCPHLCGVTLQGLADTLSALRYRAGTDFEVVAVSIDPRDGPQRAAALQADLAEAKADAAPRAWHLLTGSQRHLSRLMDRIGFRYRYDERSGRYAHPATLVLADADGRLTRYLPGIEFAPADLRLALLETGRGELGSVVDTVLLRCFSYDPHAGRYTLAIVGVMRVLGTVTALGLACALLVALARERYGGSR